QSTRYFNGLPTPAAAMLIATAVLFHEDNGVLPIPWLWFGIAITLAWLMVSRVPFFAGKDVDLKKRHPAVILLGMLVLIVFIMANPHINLFVLALAYCIHGPLLGLREWKRNKQPGSDEEKNKPQTD
ncbi:MAG: hypothetical protein Q9M27_06290, partial [Mariprofundaceae bacterium]|nr:hypothetical protein [Mariprofundaceae bacterium]